MVALRGYPWTKREIEYLRVANSTRVVERMAKIDRQARALCESGLAFIKRVRAFQADLTVRDLRTDFIIALDPFSEYEQELERRIEHGVEADERHVTARRLFVSAWDKAGPWWWPDRHPTRTDLAVLSILAGNMPDVRCAMSKSSFDPTPAAVIEREAVYIDCALKSLGLRSSKRRRVRS